MTTIAQLRRFSTLFGKQISDEAQAQLFTQELDFEIFLNGHEETFFVAQKANFGDLSSPTLFYFKADCAEELLAQLGLSWISQARVNRYGDTAPLWSIFADGELFVLQRLQDKIREDVAGMNETTRRQIAQRIEAPFNDAEFLELALVAYVKEVGYGPLY